MATKAEALADILARLKAATGPDRELDVAIVQTLFPGVGECRPHCLGDEPIFWHEPFRKMQCPRLTASIDAALALVEKMLPGWTWDADATAPECGIDWSLHEPKRDGLRVTGTAPTPALAILIALVSAMIAQESATPTAVGKEGI